MTIKLKQSTASQEVPLGYFLDSTDGNTEETGLTIANTDIKLWKAGATTLANKNSGGATHISNGIYYAVLDATDTDTLGSLVVFVHVAGALPVRLECEVLAANVYDSLVGATDLLQVDTTQVGGTAQTAGDIVADTNDIQARLPAALVGGRIDANVGAMGADVITSTALAASAVTEIQSGLSTLDGPGVRTAVGLAAANLDTQLGAIDAKTTNLPTDPADQSLVIAATDAIMTRLGAPAGLSVSADIAAVKADSAAILIDTAEIGAAGAGLTALASAANLATLSGYVDTEVAAVKAQTDKLTFNASNAVKANITHVIDDAVQQNGSTTTNWGGTP